MSDSTVCVYVDLDGMPRLAGRLWSRARKGRESATFEYSEEWRAFDESFALSPALRLGPGPHHTGQGRALFSALGDSAPDRWGRTLIARKKRQLAREEGCTPRTLWEIDYLLGVSDVVRQGALRFAHEEGGPFVAQEGGVPPLVRLPRLLAATEHVLADDETADDLHLLLAPGSSLGGARPKASVSDKDGSLLIAKFPAETDSYDLVRWEAVALSLAEAAGIPTPDWRLEVVGDGIAVLLVQRFDRAERIRRPFLSAMSMLDAWDGEMRSYVEIADALRQHGAEPGRDLLDLWRRIVFNVLISNTDDHLRNHGFLYAGKAGWRLSPAYDLNPVPIDIKPRVLSTAIGLDQDLSASLELALEVARSFGLSADDAASVVREVVSATEKWREVAHQCGVSGSEIDRLSTAFEHNDLVEARGI